MMVAPRRQVLRWDPYLEPDEDDMEFRLTYSGRLLAHTTDRRLPERSLHVHDIRKEFHKQLTVLWQQHPNLNVKRSATAIVGGQRWQEFQHDGFTWRPLVTEDNGLICKLEILLLRHGAPGHVMYDIDNRIKTLFDALRMAKGPAELGQNTSAGMQQPEADEVPFLVLLQDDSLITHVAVTSDMLLEPVPNIPPDEAARVVMDVTVRPYDTHMGNLEFA